MLNKNFLSFNCFFKAPLAFIIFVLLIILSCGKRQLPLPPTEKTTQTVEISATQRGNIITLTWNLPVQNSLAGSTLNIDRAHVYRLAEPLTQPLVFSEDEFASQSTLITTIPITVEDFRRKQITFNDVLELSGQNLRLRYAIRLANAFGQKAPFSNFLLIEPTVKVAGNPNSLAAQITEDAITLNWNAPVENVDGSIPVNIIGYNIYRTNDGMDSAKILNTIPVSENKFNDQSFEFGMNYKYFVRTVSLSGAGAAVESLDSNTIEVKPVDVFAPSKPSAITIAAAPKSISIFFAVNPEKDVAGYRVYRSITGELPLADWTLITNELLTTNTFRDINVESGKTYFYYLTAIDKNGNVSEVSDIISETVP